MCQNTENYSQCDVYQLQSWLLWKGEIKEVSVAVDLSFACPSISLSFLCSSKMDLTFPRRKDKSASNYFDVI